MRDSLRRWGIRSVMVAAVLALHGTTSAELAEWKLNTSGNWETASNWLPAIVPNNLTTPGVSYQVTISSSSNVTSLVDVNKNNPSGNIVVNSILLDGPLAHLRLNSGRLTALQGITVNNGLFEIPSNAQARFRGRIAGTGGTVSIRPGLAGVYEPTLDTVTLSRNVTLAPARFGDSISIVNGLTLDGGTFVANPAGETLPVLQFKGGQTLGGTGQIAIPISAESGALTIGPNVTVTADPSAAAGFEVRSFGYVATGATMANNGLITVDGSTRPRSIEGNGRFLNNGTVRVRPNNSLQVETNLLPGTGTWIIDEGASLWLGNNTTSRLNYRFAELGTFVNTGGTLTAGGLIENSNATITTNTLNPSFRLLAEVTGGTVGARAANQKIEASGSTFTNVRVVGTLDATLLQTDGSNAWAALGMKGQTLLGDAEGTTPGLLRLTSAQQATSLLQLPEGASVAGNGSILLASANSALISGTYSISSGVDIQFTAPTGTVAGPSNNPAASQVASQISASDKLVLSSVTYTGNATAANRLVVTDYARTSAATVGVSTPSGVVEIGNMNIPDLPTVRSGARVEYGGVIDLGGGSYDPTLITTGDVAMLRSVSFKNGTLAPSRALAIGWTGNAGNDSQFHAIRYQGHLSIPSGTQLRASGGLDVTGQLTISGGLLLNGAQTLRAGGPIQMNGGAIYANAPSNSIVSIDSSIHLAPGTSAQIFNEGGFINVAGDVVVSGKDTRLDFGGNGTGSSSRFSGRMLVSDEAAATFRGAPATLTGSIEARGRSAVTINRNSSSAGFINNGLITLGDALLWVQQTTANSMRTQVVAGLGDGTWNGTAGIRLDTADAVGRDRLGFAPTTIFAASNSAVAYAGVQPRNSGFVVFATILGDTDLDQRVEFDDLLRLAQAYGKTSGAGWHEGDFDYNGKVNFDDLLILAQAYPAAPAIVDGAAPAFSADWALARSMVPEPTLLFATAVPFVSSLRRRRGGL